MSHRRVRYRFLEISPQGEQFEWYPPQFSKYKIFLLTLTLRELFDQFTLKLGLRQFRGAPVKWFTF